MKIYNYFILLWIGCLIGAFTVIPYALLIQGKQLELLTVNSLLLIGLQSAIMYAVIICLGAYCARKIGITFLPFKKNVSVKNDLITPAIFVAILSAFLVVSLDIFAFKQPLSNLGKNIPIIYALAASLYGGINEEVLLRLFFLSLVAWLLSKISLISLNASIMMGIIASSVIFGLGHLFITGHSISLTWMLVMRALILNGIPGMLFGWLYWKKSLETAMLSHFLTDIFLHSILYKIL